MCVLCVLQLELTIVVFHEMQTKLRTKMPIKYIFLTKDQVSKWSMNQTVFLEVLL